MHRWYKFVSFFPSLFSCQMKPRALSIINGILEVHKVLMATILHFMLFELSNWQRKTLQLAMSPAVLLKFLTVAATSGVHAVVGIFFSLYTCKNIYKGQHQRGCSCPLSADPPEDTRGSIRLGLYGCTTILVNEPTNWCDFYGKTKLFPMPNLNEPLAEQKIGSWRKNVCVPNRAKGNNCIKRSQGKVKLYGSKGPWSYPLPPQL